jgi:hypothetical protein
MPDGAGFTNRVQQGWPFGRLAPRASETAFKMQDYANRDTGDEPK